MTFDGNELDVNPIPVEEPLHHVFADLMAGKDTVKILVNLNRGYPFAHTDQEEFPDYGLRLSEADYISILSRTNFDN